MNLLDLFRMAIRTVIANPLRTALTMLGIIIGVSSVITLVSIGKGTSAAIEKQYESLGTNLLVVNLLGNGRATQLDYNELMQLEANRQFNAMAPTIQKGGSNVKYEREQDKYNVTGSNDRFLPLMKASVDKGRLLSDADLEFRNHVAVLGVEVAQRFFGDQDPIGETVNIDGSVYTVIGTLKKVGSNIGGTSVDKTVVVPLTTLQRDFKLGTIRTTYIEAASKDSVAGAQNLITAYLTQKFRSSTGFVVFNQDQLLSARVAASSSLTNQLVSVACISLLVGGIGIMNIMLVTVSERTREIGIRKSIGAKRQNILVQFLVEATVISGMGGLAGLVLGIAATLLWPVIQPSQATKLSMDIGLYAFLFSALIGVVFGLYPANKASRLRPIDALRFD